MGLESTVLDGALDTRHAVGKHGRRAQVDHYRWTVNLGADRRALNVYNEPPIAHVNHNTSTNPTQEEKSQILFDCAFPSTRRSRRRRRRIDRDRRRNLRIRLQANRHLKALRRVQRIRHLNKIPVVVRQPPNRLAPKSRHSRQDRTPTVSQT